MVSSSGSLTASTSYDAWGNPETTGGLTSHTPFGFAGGYTDPSGLIYLIGRYYDPETGQFLSVDPLVAETGQSYVYTGDDPVNGVDPLGLCTSNGIFLVPGACDFTSRAWVAEVEGYFEVQKTQEMEGGWAKFWGGIEDFGDTLTGNPLAYCGSGSSEEAGLANALDDVAGFADGAGNEGDDGTFSGISDEGGSGAEEGGINPSDVADNINSQAQSRHVLGTSSYQGGGYFTSQSDAQQVLSDFKNGAVTVLGRTRAGDILVQDDNVTGYNNNPGAGYLDQPTNRFVIKGITKVSIFPTSPNAQPTP